MVFSGQIGQTSYSREMAVAVPGGYLGMGQYSAITAMNTSAGVRGVYTITPPGTPDANATYTVVVDGFTVSVVTGGSTTTAQLGQLIGNALRADAQIGRRADISIASDGVVTLTALLFNTPIVITAPTNAATTGDLVIGTGTAPGTNGIMIPYGRFVGRLAADTANTNNLNGVGPARLVAAASGYTVLGVTMKTMLERSAIGTAGKDGYPFLSQMSIMDDCVALRGIWVECVETNITPASTCCIAVGTGNEGKASSTTSGNIDFSARARFVTNTQFAPNGIPIVGVFLRR